jgi:hypothetical protein
MDIKQRLSSLQNLKIMNFKAIIIVAIIFIGTITNKAISQTQSTNTWKGGTPGQTANWNCPKNWSTGRVPDAFQNVIIPDVSTGSGVYPVIKTGGQEVNAIVLESGASLEITKEGSLIVHRAFEGYGSFGLEAEGALILQADCFAGVGVLKALVGR